MVKEIHRPISNALHQFINMGHWWVCDRCDGNEDTRQQILQAAFAEIHEQGYQAASLSRILNKAGVTKGALYHHFPNKHALGITVVNELIRPSLEELWETPMKDTVDPIPTLIETIRQSVEWVEGSMIRHGCPLFNLAQEMSPIDEEFRTVLLDSFRAWQTTWAEAFRRGQAAGNMKASVNPDQLALMVVATLEGCLSLAKSAQKKEVLMECGSGLLDYLYSLKIEEKNND